MRAHDGEPRSGDGRVVLAGARVVTPAGTLRSGWVAVQGGVIAALGQGLPAADGAPVQDLSGAWLVPGFVDMHVHGGGGAWLASLDPEEVDQAVRFHLGKGTTSMLASIATSPLGSMLRSAAVVAGAAAGPLAPALAGIHLEGPFISRERSGAQDPDAIRDPDPAVMGRLLEACGGWARMVTIAPELPGGLDLVRQIARSGAVPAVGHTQAGYEAATAAIDAGVRVSTHLFNAMPGRSRCPPPRGRADPASPLRVGSRRRGCAPEARRIAWAVRRASAWQVTIGLTPTAVGKALVSPTQTPGCRAARRRGRDVAVWQRTGDLHEDHGRAPASPTRRTWVATRSVLTISACTSTPFVWWSDAVVDERRHRVEHLRRRVALLPQHPAHAEEVADAHQAVRERLRVEPRHLAGAHGRLQAARVAGRQAAVVAAVQPLVHELRLPDDAVEVAVGADGRDRAR